MINYNNRRFKVLLNSENGELQSDFVFHYRQEGDVLHCHYQGGTIKAGQLLGVVQANGSIAMNYHQINQKNEIRSGECYSTPTFLPSGKIKLTEKWRWSDEEEWGYTELEEI